MVVERAGTFQVSVKSWKSHQLSLCVGHKLLEVRCPACCCDLQLWYTCWLERSHSEETGGRESSLFSQACCILASLVLTSVLL